MDFVISFPPHLVLGNIVVMSLLVATTEELFAEEVVSYKSFFTILYTQVNNVINGVK
jgi:hypothetical protein